MHVVNAASIHRALPVTNYEQDLFCVDCYCVPNLQKEEKKTHSYPLNERYRNNENTVYRILNGAFRISTNSRHRLRDHVNIDLKAAKKRHEKNACKKQ